MISVVSDEFVERKKWITNEEMVDMIAISESLPGAIAINTSISVGYKLRGVKGSIAAMLGVVTPCIIIITIVTYLYNSVPADSVVWLFINGIRAGVVGLMVNVLMKLGKSYMNNVFSISMFAVALLIALTTKIPVIFIILSGALIGYIYGKYKKKPGEQA